ncbi:MAG TPA: hypothetical protein VLM37_12605 [Fibrobacteraceae bacterium]|nr:hypothetical protein [Fibrobacteraceae bacterium]
MKRKFAFFLSIVWKGAVLRFLVVFLGVRRRGFENLNGWGNRGMILGDSL